MDILCVSCAEEVSYQLRLSTLLATWRHDKVKQTIPEVPFSRLHEEYNLLRHVVKQRYWARKHHFVTLLRMRHNVLVGWHSVDIFSIMAADRGVLYPVLHNWWGKYDCIYLLFVSRPLVLFYYTWLYLRGDPYDIRRVITLPTSEFAVLAGV